MRVVSALADIDFRVGKIRREGRDLIVESDDQSTLETRITVTPRDALITLKRFLLSPSCLVFVLMLPFSALSSDGGDKGNWEQRRQQTGLNKPW